jgi:enoyl-CoA hydratase/carnithine racemase
MAKRTRVEESKDAYANFAFERSDDGVLLMRCHTDQDSLVWNAEVHDRMADPFADVADDRDIKVVIHTGTGANYNADWGFLAKGPTPTPWRPRWAGPRVWSSWTTWPGSATCARYFLLTNQKLTAQQALERGAVNEVLVTDKLLDRAFELAHEIAKRPPMATRYTRLLFTQDLKRTVLKELSDGIALEHYAQRQFYPVGGAKGPICRSWDGPEPFVE